MTISIKHENKDIPIRKVDIPDLWHVAMLLRDQEKAGKGYTLGGKHLSELTLECWHYAHAMKKRLEQIEDEQSAIPRIG